MIGVGTAGAIGNWTLPRVADGPAAKPRPATSLLAKGRRLVRRWRRRGARGPFDGRTTAVYVGNNRLLAGATVGGEALAFYLEADDRLLTPWFALTGRYESDVTDFIVSALRPDSHCLDIGANFGFFLCLMARHCPAGRVIAVEPDTELATLAQDNLFLNGVHDQASVVRAAAADRAGELTLFAREYRSGNTSVIAIDPSFTDYVNEPPARPFTVPSLTIDTLAERLGGRVDLIKIDVEGAEPMVLAGAARTIARNPGLAIVMEWSPGQIEAAGTPVADFAAAIVALGLRTARLVAGREVPIDIATLAALPYQSAIVLRPAR